MDTDRVSNTRSAPSVKQTEEAAVKQIMQAHCIEMSDWPKRKMSVTVSIRNKTNACN